MGGWYGSGVTPPAHAEAVAVRADDASVAEEITEPVLTGRLRSRRTVVSIVLTVSLLGVVFWRAGIDWHATWNDIRRANLGLWLAAAAAYYLAMAARTLRWQLLLRNTGEDHPIRPLGEILMASFFVNCVVPAKLGDLYRALQLRSRRGARGGNAFGTLIAERLIDLFTLMTLLVLAGVVSFHNSVPSELVPGLIAGGVLCLVGGGLLVVLASGRGARVLARLPERMVERYEHFRVGTIGAFGRWPEVLPLSLVVWGLEGVRLGLVIAALGLAGAVGPAHFLLVALVAALLTTVPFLPGGLGLVETGIVAVLAQTAPVSRQQATSIALLDRSISFGTLILVGGVFFLLLQARPVATPLRPSGAVAPAAGPPAV